MASTSWCSVRYFVRWSCDPVTILTTPPGRSDVSNTFWEVKERWGRRGGGGGGGGGGGAEGEGGREGEQEEGEERVNDD